MRITDTIGNKVKLNKGILFSFFSFRKWCFFFLGMSFFFYGNSHEVSYHLKRIKNSFSDTVVINSYNFLTEYYLYEDNDSARYYSDKSIAYSLSKNLKNRNFKGYYLKAYLELINGNAEGSFKYLKTASAIAKHNEDFEDETEALVLKGVVHQKTKQNKEALECFLTAFRTSKERDNRKGLMEAGIYLGLYYKDINDNTEALNYFLQVYPVAVKEKDTSSLFNCCINIGSLYERTKDPQKALKFYRTALQINNADNDENGIAICYFKIGRLYAGINENDSAQYYLNETMKIHLKRKDELGLIFDYSFLASMYAKKGDLKLAVENYDRSLELAQKHQDSVRIAMVYEYKATMYYEKGDFENALKFYHECLRYVTKKMALESQVILYRKISDIYEKKKMYKEAFDNHVIYKMLSDSLFNTNDVKKQTELKMSFEFDQVEEKMRADARETEMKNEAEQEKERARRNYLVAGLILVSVLLLMAIRNYLNKRKANEKLALQNKEIETQKKIVEEKNKEIGDSINYAQHIQSTCLPEKSEINEWFPQHGILFKPKDVVSGDFYWAASQGNSVLIAVADCTGHGVPGAITSMIGSMLLNEIFYVKKIMQPDLVLTELNRLVKLTLRQNEKSISKDGMDVAFCLWEKNTNRLLFSGANRPLYIVNKDGILNEVKPTKLSIGGFTPMIQDFELQEYQLSTGDTVIMSSDGYADQFGGEKEKKITTRSFKSFLTEVNSLLLEDRVKMLDEKLISWQGRFQQTDDILVFLFKV